MQYFIIPRQVVLIPTKSVSKDLHTNHQIQ
jgi:hypothetical protein